VAVGRFDVAEPFLMEAIEDPGQAAASFYLLTTIRKMKPEDLPLIERMRDAKVDAGQGMNLNYALGKSYDDLKQYGEAIVFFRRSESFAP
jgi:hypothetical protein